MKIIIDTREQLPLEFTGHETTRHKLDEGDYATEQTEDYVVIERKSLDDFYSTITHNHIRFKSEIIRARAKHKVFYIFIEGSLETFYGLKWTERKLKTTGEILRKIVNTMRERYTLSIIECDGREDMSKKILQTLEMEEELRKKTTEMKKWN